MSIYLIKIKSFLSFFLRYYIMLVNSSWIQIWYVSNTNKRIWLAIIYCFHYVSIEFYWSLLYFVNNIILVTYQSYTHTLDQINQSKIANFHDYDLSFASGLNTLFQSKHVYASWKERRKFSLKLVSKLKTLFLLHMQLVWEEIEGEGN